MRPTKTPSAPDLHSTADWGRMISDRAALLPPATHAQIQRVEQVLGIEFPEEFRAFLLWADGGQIANRCFILFSANAGLHPEETLAACNAQMPADYPLLNIGRDASSAFGFKKSDLPTKLCAVYFYDDSKQGLDKVADSFRGFIDWAHSHG